MPRGSDLLVYPPGLRPGDRRQQREPDRGHRFRRAPRAPSPPRVGLRAWSFEPDPRSSPPDQRPASFPGDRRAERCPARRREPLSACFSNSSRPGRRKADLDLCGGELRSLADVPRRARLRRSVRPRPHDGRRIDAALARSPAARFPCRRRLRLRPCRRPLRVDLAIINHRERTAS